MEKTPSGLYIHIPFCRKKCSYCDFYSTAQTGLIGDFTNALIKEINLCQKDFELFDTIYFGGGTPSLLGPGQIKRILDVLFRKFSFTEKPHITLEANPAGLSKDDLKRYLRLGINKINIGVQSFNDGFLKTLGRIHSSGDASKILSDMKEESRLELGLDLIFSIPGQSVKFWRKDLFKALEFSPDHISCYMLTYEPETKLSLRKDKGLILPVKDKTTAAMFLMAHKVLKKSGYIHYETSNFAKNQASISKHNLKYWNGVSYLGLGPSAHSFLGDFRWWNKSSLKDYIKNLNENRLPPFEKERLSDRSRLAELILLSLRQEKGLDLKRFERFAEIPFKEKFPELIKHLKKSKMAEIKDNRFYLLPYGMLFQDSIIRRIFLEIE